jgi:hypothetical protein
MRISPEVTSPVADERRDVSPPAFSLACGRKAFDGFDAYVTDLEGQKKADVWNLVSGNGELLRTRVLRAVPGRKTGNEEAVSG